MILQIMKPVYQEFVEKSVSAAVVAQAAEIATNSTAVSVNGRPKIS